MEHSITPWLMSDWVISGHLNKGINKSRNYHPLQFSFLALQRIEEHVLYLGFPLHPRHRNSQQKDDGQSPDDTNVVQFVSHQGVDILQPTTTAGARVRIRVSAS